MKNEEVRALISEDVLIRLHGYYACAVEPTRQDHDCITAADALTALLARAEAAESALAVECDANEWRRRLAGALGRECAAKELLARAESALATVRRDAERYLAWRDSH